MKRTLTEAAAYHELIGAALPEKTKTYTPLGHEVLMGQVRREMFAAGFRVSGEYYKSTEGGVVGLGQMRTSIAPVGGTPDTDLQLSCCFLNSYSTEYAFKFGLAVIEPKTGTSLMLENEQFGLAKISHTGDAEELLSGVIKDYLLEATPYWNLLVDHKNSLKGLTCTAAVQHDLVGLMFLRQGLLTTFQISLVRKRLEAMAKSRGALHMSAWEFYQVIAHALKDTHPAQWMQVHSKVHEVFGVVLGLTPPPPAWALPKAPAPVLTATAASTPAPALGMTNPCSEIPLPPSYVSAVDPTALEGELEGEDTDPVPTAVELVEMVEEVVKPTKIEVRSMRVLPKRPDPRLPQDETTPLVMRTSSARVSTDEAAWPGVPVGALSESDAAENEGYEGMEDEPEEGYQD